MEYRQKITGVILAGGRATRMQGEDKGLIQLSGKPMIEWIIDKLTPQVGALLINANRNFERYQSYHLRIVSDMNEDFCGPLSGMGSAMFKVKTPFMLTVPCDSPLITEDLANRLYEAIKKNNVEIAVAHDGKRLQPVFTLMKSSLVQSIKDFLDGGERKIDKWFEQHNVELVDFSDQPEMFLNINTPEDLKDIESRLKTTHSTVTAIPVVGFAAYSGTGKTTLIKKLISLFSDQGINVGVIKHAHHEFDIDHPGKDSYELRKAGAKQMLIGSVNRWALMVENTQGQKYTLQDHINNLADENLDLILVEGFKPELIPKIEIVRTGLNNPLFYPKDKSVIAVATDGKLPEDTDLPVLDLNAPEQIFDFICNRFL